MSKAKPKTLSSEEQLKRTIAAVHQNYYYSGVELDYDKDHSDCYDDDPYHRHCKITNITIRNIDISEIVQTFCSHITDPLLAYCVGRLPILFKLYNEDNWEHYIDRGYYGEEIDKVKIGIYASLEEAITTIWKLSNKERIFFILNKEYGYLADVIKDANDFEVIEVPTKSLHCSNTDYQKRLEREIVEGYKKSFNAAMPIGIYISDGKGYRVIDGYN